MVKEEIPFKEQEGKSIEENLALFNRARKLKERALKIINKEGENKDENTKSERV